MNILQILTVLFDEFKEHGIYQLADVELDIGLEPYPLDLLLYLLQIRYKFIS